MLIKIDLPKLNKNVPIVREQKTVINPVGKRRLEAISYDLMEYNDAQSSNRSTIQTQVQGTTGSPKSLTSRTISKFLHDASVSFMTKPPHKTYSPATHYSPKTHQTLHCINCFKTQSSPRHQRSTGISIATIFSCIKIDIFLVLL